METRSTSSRGTLEDSLIPVEYRRLSETNDAAAAGSRMLAPLRIGTPLSPTVLGLFVDCLSFLLPPQRQPHLLIPEAPDEIDS